MPREHITESQLFGLPQRAPQELKIKLDEHDDALDALEEGKSRSGADWDLVDEDGNQVVRFYFVDNTDGDDSRLGYIDGIANQEFDPETESGPLALKTEEELRRRIPRSGNGRAVVALLKSQATPYLNQAGDPDYHDENYDGYRVCLFRASDLSNTVKDKIDNGGVTDNVGPNPDGSWTATGAQSGFDITVDISSMVLPADNLLSGNKVEFLGNVTVAAAGESQCVMKRISDAVFRVPFTQTIAAGDKIFFRKPGVVVTTLKGFSGRAGMDNAVLSRRNVISVGFGFSAKVQGNFQIPGQMAFCRFDDAFNPHYGSPMLVELDYRDEANVLRRLNCGVDCRSTMQALGPITGWSGSVFHSTSNFFNNYNSGFMRANRHIGLAYFGGWSGGAGERATGLGAIVGTDSIHAKTIFSAGAKLESAHMAFDGIDLDGATKGFHFSSEASFNDVQFENVVGQLAAGQSVIDLTNALVSRIVVLGGMTALPGAAGKELLMVDGGKTFATLGVDTWRDHNGNYVFGGGGEPVTRFTSRTLGNYPIAGIDPTDAIPGDVWITDNGAGTQTITFMTENGTFKCVAVPV